MWLISSIGRLSRCLSPMVLLVSRLRQGEQPSNSSSWEHTRENHFGEAKGRHLTRYGGNLINFLGTVENRLTTNWLDGYNVKWMREQHRGVGWRVLIVLLLVMAWTEWMKLLEMQLTTTDIQWRRYTLKGQIEVLEPDVQSVVCVWHKVREVERGLKISK